MKKILIVDDDQVLLELICHIFLDEGYEVITASNGRDAYQKFLSEKPNCILTDVVMPLENGVEFTKRVLQSELPVPIAIMSGYTANVNIDSFLNSVFFIGIFSKPFDEHEIILSFNKLFANTAA